jgi:signal transduction histidine kinase
VELDPRASQIELSRETQEQLVGIVREALTNVQKHASAARVEVSADLVEDGLRVQVRDDGRGFDPTIVNGPDARPGWPRYGLIAMRERAESIGAAVDWQSAPRGGTVVTVVIPHRTLTGVARGATPAQPSASAPGAETIAATAAGAAR